MSRFQTLLKSQGAGRVWLDGTDYAARLLAGGQVAWLDVAAGIAWQRKAQDLLRSDVLTVDLIRIVEAFCSARPTLRQAMAEKKRTGFALKTLLADEGLRRHLTEWTGALHAALPSVPLCLRLPSPRHAIAEAWRIAHGQLPDEQVDEDQIDSAALYLADFLRAFSVAGLDAVLLTEVGAAPTADTQALYQSVLNVAAGYQWTVGLELPEGTTASALVDGFAFAIADAPLQVPTVVRVPTSFWTDGDAPTAVLRHAVVPADAQPEQVLQRLAVLRA